MIRGFINFVVLVDSPCSCLSSASPHGSQAAPTRDG